MQLLKFLSYNQITATSHLWSPVVQFLLWEAGIYASNVDEADVKNPNFPYLFYGPCPTDAIVKETDIDLNVKRFVNQIVMMRFSKSCCCTSINLSPCQI